VLRELPSTKQVVGEKNRRWYFSHELDLVVWFEDSGKPCGFQLAYDKYRGEHSISWHEDKGYRHYVVDEGNPLAGYPETPFLYANGPFNNARIQKLFESLSLELPPLVARFVNEKLLAFPGPLKP
jgi:hypothetical protein